MKVAAYKYSRKAFNAAVRNPDSVADVAEGRDAPIAQYADDLIKGIRQVEHLVDDFGIEGGDTLFVWLKKKTPPLAELAVLGALAADSRPDEAGVDKKTHSVRLWWD
jgi:hypothetical protein